jgi:ABC-type tungstate transport system substrate-binding protein
MATWLDGFVDIVAFSLGVSLAATAIAAVTSLPIGQLSPFFRFPADD